MIPIKCALCGDSKDDDLRFCAACATRARESILRQSTLDSALAAANIAVDYLGYLYKGKPGDTDLDLVMLAVTAAGELRTARRELGRLKQAVSDLRTSRIETPDLADLVRKTTRATERTDTISVESDGTSYSVTLACERSAEGIYHISLEDHLPLKILSTAVRLLPPWSDEKVLCPTRWCSLSHEHLCGDPESQCSYIWTLEPIPAWKVMVATHVTGLQVSLFHTPPIEEISRESSQAALEEANKKQINGICLRDAGFNLIVVSR